MNKVQEEEQQQSDIQNRNGDVVEEEEHQFVAGYSEDDRYDDVVEGMLGVFNDELEEQDYDEEENDDGDGDDEEVEIINPNMDVSWFGDDDDDNESYAEQKDIYDLDASNFINIHHEQQNELINNDQTEQNEWEFIN